MDGNRNYFSCDIEQTMGVNKQKNHENNCVEMNHLDKA